MSEINFPKSSKFHVVYQTNAKQKNVFGIGQSTQDAWQDLFDGEGDDVNTDNLECVQVEAIVDIDENTDIAFIIDSGDVVIL